MKVYNSRLEKFSLAIFPYLWVLLFLAIPLAILLKISFSEPIIGKPPYGDMTTWIDDHVLQIKITLINFASIFQDNLYVFTYFQSIKIALISTIFAIFLGYPLAYFISTCSPKWRLTFLMLVMLPFWSSFLIRIYAWIILLSPTGIINSFLMHLDIIKTPLPLGNNFFAVIIGIVYCYLPFMILPLYASLQKIDPSLLEAAYDLGCRPFKAFCKVTLPLSMSGILSGSMLIFIPAVGEFVIPELLGGPETLTIGKILWGEFFHNRDWPISAAIAVALMLLTVVPLMIIQKLQRSPHET
jgi:putrescine transport system permease protein